MTVGVTANLSTTPSSLQIMLKLSPAVGTPGIMTRGVKTALLSADKMDCYQYVLYSQSYHSPTTVSCMLSLALFCSTYCCPDDGSTVAMQVMVLPLSRNALNRLMRRVLPLTV